VEEGLGAVPGPRVSRRRDRWLWPALALPGAAWLGLFFLVPLYVVLSIAFGRLDPIYRSPIPVWNPFRWNTDQFSYVVHHIAGPNGFFGPPIVRTAAYVAIASTLCIVIAYPVAYYVARLAGRWRGILLTLLIAPFWISYMMRMLAWVNLLSTDGLVNHALGLGVFHVDVAWLSGRASTVVLGLVYGYVPYTILPLYAGLDRIDTSHIEAARDLGASRASAFRRVTLRSSAPAIVAALLLTSLPMIGDYFTNDLLSGSPSTSMVGNVINTAVATPSQAGQAGAFVILLFAVLLAPMLLYVRRISREENA
jgi:ABC-type spermidine/putrescine transport system permease subunit I